MFAPLSFRWEFGLDGRFLAQIQQGSQPIDKELKLLARCIPRPKTCKSAQTITEYTTIVGSPAISQMLAQPRHCDALRSLFLKNDNSSNLIRSKLDGAKAYEAELMRWTTSAIHNYQREPKSVENVTEWRTLAELWLASHLDNRMDTLRAIRRVLEDAVKSSIKCNRLIWLVLQLNAVIKSFAEDQEDSARTGAPAILDLLFQLNEEVGAMGEDSVASDSSSSMAIFRLAPGCLLMRNRRESNCLRLAPQLEFDCKLLRQWYVQL